MKFFKAVSLFIAVAALSTVFPRSAAALGDPDIQAKAALLVEINTGKVLYAKNEDARVYPASVTKVMTAILAVEAIERGGVSLDDMVTASSTSHEGLDIEGSTQNIVPGETMSLESLLYCAMVASANEACNIIAEHIAGDVASFVALMNERAGELGCGDTHFDNTHGLPDETHYSTARDLYLISAQAMQYPLFVRLCGTTSKEIPATNKSDVRYIYSTNNLISTVKTSEYYYQYAEGIKTGHTSEAGYCLVSSAERDGLNVISVVMGAQGVPLPDGSTEIQSFTETKRLMEWAFDSFSYRNVLSTSDLIDELPVKLGQDADTIVLYPAGSVSVLLPNDLDLNEINRDIEIYSEERGEELFAPVGKGDVLGKITLSYGGETLGAVNLVALNDISLSKSGYIRYRIYNTLNQTWVKLTAAGIVLLFVLYVVFVIRYNVVRRRRRKSYGYTGRRRRR